MRGAIPKYVAATIVEAVTNANYTAFNERSPHKISRCRLRHDSITSSFEGDYTPMAVSACAAAASFPSTGPGDLPLLIKRLRGY